MTQRDPDIQALINLVDELKSRVDKLERENTELRAENTELRAENTELRAENTELRRRLGMNSSNSSKPPSSDPPGANETNQTEKNRSKRKRKQGAQKGHKGTCRMLLPEERVDNIVRCEPNTCETCGKRLKVDATVDPCRHQVIELEDGRIVVTEYRLFTSTCACGEKNKGALPEGVAQFLLGPRMTAVIALLTGKYRLSKRNTRELLIDLFDIELCIGTISAAEKRMSDALAEPVREAEEFIREQEIVHADETGWKQESVRAWLWVAVTSAIVVFKVALSRGTDVAKDLLGKGFTGYLVTDQLGSYGWVDPARRQLCWAHLKRKFRGLSEADGEVGEYGQQLLKRTRKMFRWWGRVRDGTMSRDDFIRKMTKRFIPDFEKLLIEAALTELPGLSRPCTELANAKKSLWLFVHHEGIEPTNNAAERALRHAVIWRKTSFGTQSEAGSRFVERMLTVVASLKQQKRPVLQFLADAFQTHHSGRLQPSLLPQAC